MKKVYLILVLTLCCYSGYSQSSGFGIRAGANLSNVVDIDEKADPRGCVLHRKAEREISTKV